MRKITIKLYLLGICLLIFSTAVMSESAALTILNEVKPRNVIEVQWQGPNNKQDQIVLMDSVGNEGSAQYTRAGNPVGIGIEEYSESYKLIYKSGGEILTAVEIDCRTESLTPDGLCIVQTHPEQKIKSDQVPINEPELNNESSFEPTNKSNDNVSSSDFKAILESIFRPEGKAPD